MLQAKGQLFRSGGLRPARVEGTVVRLCDALNRFNHFPAPSGI